MTLRCGKITIEISIHITFLLIAVLSRVRVTSSSQKLVMLAMLSYAITLFLLLVNIDRNGGDIRAYEIGFSSSSHSIYFLREFLFWLPFRYIYNLWNNLEYTLFIMDVLCIFLVSLSSMSSEKFRGFTAIYIASFPALFFHENILRQGLASAFLIYMIARFINSEGKKNNYISVLLVAVHNFTIIFLPFLFIHRARNFFLKVIFAVLFAALISVAASSRNSIQSGLPLDRIFHAYFIMLLFLIVMLRNGKGKNHNDFALKLFLFFAVMLGFVIGDSQYERFSYTALLITQLFLMSLADFKYSLNRHLLIYGNMSVLLLPKFLATSSIRLIAQ